MVSTRHLQGWSRAALWSAISGTIWKEKKCGAAKAFLECTHWINEGWMNGGNTERAYSSQLDLFLVLVPVSL